jgi:hypothetical protein
MKTFFAIILLIVGMSLGTFVLMYDPLSGLLILAGAFAVSVCVATDD